MELLTTSGWDNYKLLDTGNSQRLEKWGPYTLIRPDPQTIWKPSLGKSEWEKADAVFEKNIKQEGWVNNKIPDQWEITYKDLILLARLTPFKHTGIFPEQTLQWDFIQEKIKKANREVSVLNLFAYTGGASLAAAKENAKVTHVDASRPSIGWAKQNQEVSHLLDKPIRYILEDVISFTKREIKRGKKYDAIIMDPPVYGHGPHGERWDFYKDMPTLLNQCKELLSTTPLFFIVNAYAISASSLLLKNVMSDLLGDLKGVIQAGELGLQEQSGRVLSTGIFARFESV